MVTRIQDDVFWVGVIDWSLREFHGHELSTHRGSSYNAYLIKDEKTVLVDTAWAPFQDEFLRTLREACDPSTIDYIVVNHSEIDHAGALPAVAKLAPKAEILVSKKGLNSVPGHFPEAGLKLRAVSTGEKINIGRRDLVFIEATMLHWPDSMFTYLTGNNLLLPNDAFGQHYATASRFNDEVNNEELWHEALKYYANILTPFSDLALKKIDEVLKLNLPIDMIAPSHGVIWRKDPIQIVKKYQEWARQEPNDRVAILYDTMWDATGSMAMAIADGIAAAGVDHRVLHLSLTDRNDVITEIFKSGKLIVGAPTVNNTYIASLAHLLLDLKALRFKNKRCAAFGSYGWSGEAVKHIEEVFAACKFPLLQPGLKCQWKPTAEVLKKCREFGRACAEA